MGDPCDKQSRKGETLGASVTQGGQRTQEHDTIKWIICWNLLLTVDITDLQRRPRFILVPLCLSSKEEICLKSDNLS